MDGPSPHRRRTRRTLAFLWKNKRPTGYHEIGILQQAAVTYITALGREATKEWLYSLLDSLSVVWKDQDGRPRPEAATDRRVEIPNEGKKMAGTTQVPKACPICGSNSVTRMMNDTLLSAKPDGLAPHMLEVVAYQCDAAHVFLLVNDGFWWRQPRKSGSGYEIAL